MWLIMILDAFLGRRLARDRVVWVADEAVAVNCGHASARRQFPARVSAREALAASMESGAAGS